MKRYLIGLTAALAVTVFWPGAASASAGWTVDPMPLPTGAPHGLPTGVSCQAAGNCIAVGTGPSHALAWHWNGSAWALTHAAVPVGAQSTGLSAVSCPSALECIAVGAQATASKPHGVTLAEQWNGARWHAQSTPNPAATLLSGLDAVSCDSPNSCTAVGTAEGNSEFTLAEHWNGTTWAIQPTPTPPKPIGLDFAGVSCPFPADCFAVGSTDSGPFAESWNGTSWTLLPVPLPAGATSGGLTGISCAGNATCTAVGTYLTGTGIGRPLAEQFQGGSWKPKALPLPATGTSGGLAAVSCATETDCTATGSFNRASVTPQALAEVWNGTAWALQPTARPVSHKILLGVSCTAARTCSAVGDDTTDGIARRLALPLAEHE
jgi:hypothetical protein